MVYNFINVHGTFYFYPQYSLMFQDIQLFSGSIIENITMGREGINEDDIVEASKISGLDDFLGKMPGGYELVLQDKGKGLSGGQRQAIALTRAIVHKPTHYILDEPTSAMDMNSETHFINNFKNIIQDSTLIVVSHRMPLVNLVDRVVVMNGGKIIEDGPKEEILSKLQSTNN